MKKLIGFMAAGLILAGCSDDNDSGNSQTPVIPLGQVTLQSATPDNAAVSVPAVSKTEYDNASAANVRTAVLTFANGQVLTFSTNKTKQNAALTKIEGSAESITVPSAVTLGNEVFTVDSIGIPDLVPSPLCETVREITLPSTIKSSASTYTQRLNNFPNLNSVRMEAGFSGFVSINGAVYTADMKKFIYCPLGRDGEFSIADGTETICSRAFDPESRIIRVVIPASMKEIEDEAFLYNNSLQVVNILATMAPVARERAFGYYARRATLVIPQGCRASYIVARPAENADESAQLNYDNHKGYTFFETVSEYKY